MQLTPFEAWLVPALIIGLVGIVGFFIVQVFFSKRKDTQMVEDPQPLTDSIDNLEVKIDKLVVEVMGMKTQLAVGSEKFKFNSKEIQDLRVHVEDHEVRIRKIEHQHAKNHGDQG